MVSLREMKEEDKDMLRTWRNLPEVAQFMYSDHHISREEHERWFVEAMGDPIRKYWIIMHDGQDVGLVNIYNLDKKNSRCSWAFYIASPDVRGKGVGAFVEISILRYVFDVLGLNKLCCEVIAFNEPVVRMHKKFGFQQEGLFREHVIKAGKPLDVVSLAILRNDWNKIRPELEERFRKGST